MPAHVPAVPEEVRAADELLRWVRGHEHGAAIQAALVYRLGQHLVRGVPSRV